MDAALGDDADDHLIAALLMREARNKAELAESFGISAFLEQPLTRPRPDQRLLRGELAQARSFNLRAGAAPAMHELPARAPKRPSAADSLEKSLEREYIREAARRRMLTEAAAAGSTKRPCIFCVPPCNARKPPRPKVVSFANAFEDPAKRQSEGSASEEEEEDAHAARDLQLSSSRGARLFLPCHLHRPPRPPPPFQQQQRAALWPSLGLRVRVVDCAGTGGVLEQHHLRQGVVCGRVAERGSVLVRMRGAAIDAAETAETSGTAGVVEAAQAEAAVVGAAEAELLVPQECLETVVSRGCRNVEVVRGEHAGRRVELVGRCAARSGVSVSLGGAIVQMGLDCVCEFEQ